MSVDLNDNNIQRFIQSSVWQRQKLLHLYGRFYFVFSPKTKICFDLLFYSFFFKKFCNNFSLNYNYGKVYNLLLALLLNLRHKYKIKGIFLLYCLVFNLIFSSFFEITKVRVAGRLVKVPNPLMFNKSYRIIPKTLTQLMHVTKGNTVKSKFFLELDDLLLETGSFINYEKNKIVDVVDNRMFSNFRWKYKKISGNVTRFNP